jgi:glycosyltransferase involved in cell wall biosynthesis
MHRSVTERLPRRVLYIQHAGCLGGSANSLRYLVEPMQAAGVDCVVALARPCRQLQEFYGAAGIRTVDAPDIVCWDHSTVARRSLANPRHVVELCRVAARWRSSMRATLRLVDAVGPDLVHLNSMPLSSSACALRESGVPFVWHVREPPPDQGMRTALIRSMMRAAPCCVFITAYDKQQWVGDSPGRIIYNCVPDTWFERGREPPPNRPAAGPVRFAYLGGMAMSKGGDVLVRALRMLRGAGSRWECVMPGSLIEDRYRGRERLLKRVARAFGVRSNAELLTRAYSRLSPAVQLLPVTTEIARLLQTVDFVVFPAAVPHFPRPVIEAAALGLPAVGSDVGGVNECIVDRDTGLLCRPGDAGSLAAAIDEMIDNPALRRDMGSRAYDRAVAVNTLTAQHREVARVYGEVIASGKESA